MPIDDEKLYAEAGQEWRHFAAWREKTFAGYLTTVAALAIGFLQNTAVPVRATIFGGGILVSAVFWILDFRNVQLINACQVAAARLEGERGCYSELNRMRFDLTLMNSLTYSLAVTFLVAGVSAGSFAGVCIYTVRLWRDNLTMWPVILAGVFAIAVTICSWRLVYKPWLIEQGKYRTERADSETNP